LNIYILVEGEIGEKFVYREWVNYLNPTITYVDYPTEIEKNNYAIVAGFGYPFYFEVIDNAIEEINQRNDIDRLVISVDSEEFTMEEKQEELINHLNGKRCKADIRIIIQHFCLETWALGNRLIISRTPDSVSLREYIRYYDILQNDPELLPGFKNYSRVFFAEKYLRAALNDKYKNLTYTKSNPKVMLHPRYFTQIKNRFEETGHINSFSMFLDAFV
jgi:hypothetical protein